MTLVEAAIASALTSLVVGVALVAASAAGSTASVAGALAGAQRDAERIAALVAEEVRTSGPGEPGRLTTTSTGLQGARVDRAEYARCVGVDSGPPATLRWSPRRVITFDRDGAEVPGNGHDDDGDLLVDEGRVVLHVAGVPPGHPSAIVLGRDVAAFELRSEPGPERGQPCLSIAVTVERLLAAALTSSGDVERAGRGRGARVTHIGRALVPLLD